MMRKMEIDMDKLDVIIWMVGAGFTVIFSLMLIMWHNLSSRIEKLEERISKVEMRLTVIETILHMKECCRIQDERKLPKAE